MDKIAQVQIGPTFGSPFGQGLGFADLVSIILSNAVALSGIILLILLIFGGFSIIMGAGSNNPEQVGRGKKAVTSALIGFLIVFTAYWIIYLAGLLFGFSLLHPPGL